MEPVMAFNPTEWIDWVLEHEQEDIHRLALRYAGKKLPLQAMIAQVKGRQIARNKLPTWYGHPSLWYPDTLISEQCSSEATAILKAGQLKGQIVADLTGGLGVDSQVFSMFAERVYYTEPDSLRCSAARWNFAQLNCNNIVITQADAETMIGKGFPERPDTIYLDPSRRNAGGRKVFLLTDLEPDILLLKDRLLLQAERLMVKLSPMLDIRDLLRILPEISEIDIIAWKRECRELVIHLGKKEATVQINCYHAESGQASFSYPVGNGEYSTLPLSAPLQWIYEPHAAVRKSGAWKELCHRFGISALHPNTHLFTSDEELKEFPGRKFRLLDILPFRKTEILERLAGRPVQQVFYNFPEPAAAVIKRMNLSSGEPLYLFYIKTKSGSPEVLLTECVSAEVQIPD